MDGSGWTVATGGSNAAARRNDPTSSPVMADLSSIDPMWMVAGLAIVAAVIIKRTAAK